MAFFLWHNQIKCLNYSLNNRMGRNKDFDSVQFECDRKGVCAHQNCHSIDDNKHQMCEWVCVCTFVFIRAHKDNCQLSNAIQFLRQAIKTANERERVRDSEKVYTRTEWTCCHRRFIYYTLHAHKMADL